MQAVCITCSVLVRWQTIWTTSDKSINLLATNWCERMNSQYPFAPLWCKIMEDEMRILLRHCSKVWNVMSHHCVIQRIVRCRTMRQVTDDHTICIINKIISELKSLTYNNYLRQGGNVFAGFCLFVCESAK